MKYLLRSLFYTILLFSRGTLFGQFESDPSMLDQQLNDESTHTILSQEMSNETEMSLKKVQLSRLIKSNFEEFKFLNNKDKTLLQKYIQQHKPLLSVLELQSIQEIDLEKIEKLILHIEDDFSELEVKGLIPRWEETEGRVSLRWAREFPKPEEFNTSDSLSSSYLGSPDKLFIRASFTDNEHYQLGIITEKDPGELIWSKGSRTGLDYLSAHAFIKKPFRNIHSIALGDYRMRIGQGIILDNSFIAASLIDPGFMVKSPDFLKPYQSLQENNMMRGAAIQFQPSDNSSMNLFYSKSRIDANLSLPDSSIGILDQDQQLASILNSGLHRTKSETDDRNKLLVQYAGGYYKRSFQSNYIGISLVNAKQDIRPQIESSAYRILVNDNTTQWYTSFFHQWTIRGTLFFGEIASDKSFHLATVQGLLKGLGKYADFAVFYRNFSPSFNSRLSQVFSSGGRSQNERGFNGIFNFHVNSKFKINLNWNSWNSSWIKYRVDQLPDNHEMSIRMAYTKKRKWTAYLQMNNRYGLQNTPILNENKVSPVQNLNIRTHFEIKINRDWTWRMRFEIHEYKFQNSKEYGYLSFQDILFKGIENSISGNLRLSFFQTDSYNSRIYVFENDMLYQYSIPSFYGTGTSAYANIRFRLSRSWIFEARYSVVYIGYNDNRITDVSNHNQEIKFQIHYTLR